MANDRLQILRYVLASPSDVEPEWKVVDKVVEDLNHGLARELGFRIEVATWRTDAFPGFHPEGPQGQIDSSLRIEDADGLIAIFWTRFGTPVRDAESGTQHEIIRAVEAWRLSGRPHVMVYFKTTPYSPQNQVEHEQWSKVRGFRDNFPEDGLWGSFKTKAEFETQLRRDLTNALRARRTMKRSAPRAKGTPAPKMPQPVKARLVRLLKRLVTIAMSVACLALAALVWDFCRLKVTRFANVERRWSVPEGVGRITTETGQRRAVHFQVESRYHKVRRVLRRNGANELIDGDGVAAIQEIYYRHDGTVQQIDHRDQNEKLVRREIYGLLHHKDDGDIQYVDLHAEHKDEPLALDSSVGVLGGENDDDSGWRSASEITSQELLYDPIGRLSTMMYLNAYRQIRPNREGIYGQRYKYPDTSLQPNQIVSLGADGIPARGWNGVLLAEISRNAFGDVTDQRFLGGDRQPVLPKEGCHRESYTLDQYGNELLFTCWGVDEEPTLFRQSYHKAEWAVDSRGNVVRGAFFGTDGKPALEANGIHSFVQVFDGLGYLTAVSYFGIDNEPTLHKDGFHKILHMFDGPDNETSEAFFDTNGKPTLDNRGVHKIRSRFDSRGNLVEEAFFSIAGKPAMNRNGVHLIKSRFDARDHLVRQTYFDAYSKPTVVHDGFHRVSLTFDSRGNLTEEALFGTDNKPASHASGFHRVRNEFDERGNRRKTSYFGIDGKPALVGGSHSVVNTFDIGRRVGESTHFGVDGQPVVGAGGFHKTTYALDGRGNVIEEAFFGIDGAPTLHRDGDHKRTFVVDENGNRIELASFGIDGRPTADRFGVHRFKTRFDSRGNGIEQAAFGVDGQPTVNRQGIHKTIQSYDSRGNLTEHAVFDIAGRPWFPEDGVQKLTRRFDDLGNVAEETRRERFKTVTTAPTTFNESLASWESAMHALAGTEARFVQRLTQMGFTKAQVESGTVVFGVPPRMRWTYQKPEAKLFVFDGQTSWFYVAQDRTVTIVHSSESARAASPFAFLFDPAWIKTYYRTLQAEGGTTLTTHLYATTPAASIPAISVTRTATNNLINRVEYVDQHGSLMVFELAAHRKVALPSTLFGFDVPDGVAIVTVDR